jgi:mono/diheme cytochrome c family protein
MQDGQWLSSPGRWAAGWCAVLACCLGGAVANAADAAKPPVVPGYSRLKDEAKVPPQAQGEVLLGELNCLSCHAAPNQKRIFTRGAPDLSTAGSRMTPQFILSYLSHPHQTKPGTVMPDLFHASDPQAKQGAVEFLTHYLVSLGGPIKQATEQGNASVVEQGRKLFHSVGCVACHAPEKKPNTAVPSFPLADLAEKTTVDQLIEFLLDPIKIRPDSRMPNFHLSRGEATSIAIYLLRDQLDNPQNQLAGPVSVHGVKYVYYEEATDSAAIERIEKLTPKSDGVLPKFSLEIPGRRAENFVVKLSGTIHVPRDGRYTFGTNSDDGSRLYIDKQLIVNNDGVHAAARKGGAVELKEGDHEIVVTYFQGGNEAVLNVTWGGPQMRREEIPTAALMVTGGRPMIPLHSEPFTVDPQKAQMGGRMFAMIGCVNCHAISDEKPVRQIKALAELNADADTGCLGNHPSKQAANYDLSNDQRMALKTAVKNAKELDQPLDPKEQVVHTMAAFNCLACHVRGNVGGATPDRSEFFTMTAEFDMGDEGRLPPRLTGVGAKLLPEAVAKIVFENKLHIRPVLATRMPTFSKEKVGGIGDALEKADASGPDRKPEFTETFAKDGRTIIGTRGLGCVNCHGVLGVKSLGMPAPDLTTEHERLRPNWFHALLVNPPAMNPATRMPQFWPEGQVAFANLAGGTMDSQIDAIWDYLSLGQTMALPAGLQPSSDELIPLDQPIVHRTMMAGAGNRSILVGFPESVHVAFDGDIVRMAKAWKGRFWDAKGFWEGRGGEHLSPLGQDVIDLPPGPAIAVLNSPGDPWPTPKAKDRDLGGKFKGYVLDKNERPTFHYVLKDTIDIHEQPLPKLVASGPQLIRSFHIDSKEPAGNVYFLAAQGNKIEAKSPTEWVVDGKLTIRLTAEQGTGQPAVRDSNGAQQLLIPVTGKTSAFSVEMSW